MTVIENHVDIDRSPEEVFDYLVDLRNEAKWNPDVESMEKITEGPIGMGTKFLAKWKQSDLLEVECTRYERPRAWCYCNGGPVSVQLDITVTPQGSGSHLTARFDAHPHGMMKLFFPVFLQVMKRSEKRNMPRMKAAVESTPVPFDGRLAHD